MTQPDEPVKRILFVMIDQLRWDYLSCYGHQSLETPHIDSLAARGVRFNRAYVQGTSCGNSRASFYTGRYVRSHGGTWNDVPFEMSHHTLADYMKDANIANTVLIGKTHMAPDLNALARLGIDPETELGRYLANTGFDRGERDDGLHGEGPDGNYSKQSPRYNSYLREHGFGGSNPWLDWANSAAGPNGELQSGFYWEHADKAARIPKEFSESAYMTDRAIEAIEQAGDQSWCVHLSYIKPHWPYIAPAPYHQLYGAEDIQAVQRHDVEAASSHPVYRAFAQSRWSQAWSHASARETVIPAYMGLVKQLDDEIGRLLAYLDQRGLLESTMIALTADHGDYLGDHWLGEKDLFHDTVAKVPMIVVDPRPAADSTRGSSSEQLVEAIDLVPTFISAAGGEVPGHRLEGRSLLPLLHALPEQPPAQGWRDSVYSECDYGRLPVRTVLKRGVNDARLTMSFDGRYKFIHCMGFKPMLFDLQEDPQEFHDRGTDPSLAGVRETIKDQMLDWSAGLRNRTAMTDAVYTNMIGGSARRGILIGFWSAEDVPLAQKPTPRSVVGREPPIAGAQLAGLPSNNGGDN